MIYEWDPRKAAANRSKRGISFDDAASVFLDPLALTFPDRDHSEEEQREITIDILEGSRSCSSRTAGGAIRVRIISARRATPRERGQYEEGITEYRG